MNALKKLLQRLLGSVVLPAGIVVGSFHIFNSLGEFSFVVAVVLAFCIGSYAIYLVFKYWINVEVGRETPEQQLTRYSVIFIVNLAIYTQLVFALVNYAYMPAITAQAISAVIVAYLSFYAYRSLVFRERKNKKTVAQVIGKASAANPERL